MLVYSSLVDALELFCAKHKKKQREVPLSLKKWATVGECSHLSPKKGVLSCCWVGTTGELGTTNAETHITGYLFLAL